MFDLIEFNIIKYERPEDKRIVLLLRKVNKLIREYKFLEPIDCPRLDNIIK